MPEDKEKTYLERALEDGYAEITGEGKTEKIKYKAVNHHMRHTVKTREELEEHLRELATSAFYAYAPRDSGEFVFECDENGIVDDVLSSYEVW